jgi:hypothetical protein
MQRYRQHYDINRVDRRRRAAVDFLGVLLCALLFGLPMFIYLWNMKP